MQVLLARGDCLAIDGHSLTILSVLDLLVRGNVSDLAPARDSHVIDRIVVIHKCLLVLLQVRALSTAMHHVVCARVARIALIVIRLMLVRFVHAEALSILIGQFQLCLVAEGLTTTFSQGVSSPFLHAFSEIGTPVLGLAKFRGTALFRLGFDTAEAVCIEQQA